MQQVEQIEIIKYWLGREGLPFLESFTQEEQENCNTTEAYRQLTSQITEKNILG